MTDIDRHRVAEALAGKLPEDALTDDERVAFNAMLDASITEAARTTSFGQVLAARGETTVALNDDGELTVYRPDGTSSPLR